MQTPDYAKQIKRAYTRSDVKKSFLKMKKSESLMHKKIMEIPKPAVMKRVAKKGQKSLARKLVGKVGAKAIPGVGAAAVAHDVMRAGAEKGCIKRGGKWVSGKCQIAKKPRTKASGPDKRFAKSRSKK